VCVHCRTEVQALSLRNLSLRKGAGMSLG